MLTSKPFLAYDFNRARRAAMPEKKLVSQSFTLASTSERKNLKSVRPDFLRDLKRKVSIDDDDEPAPLPVVFEDEDVAELAKIIKKADNLVHKIANKQLRR